MALVTILFCFSLQSILEKLLLMNNLAKFRFQTNLHGLLKSIVDGRKMEYFVFKLLNLIYVSEMLRV